MMNKKGRVIVLLIITVLVTAGAVRFISSLKKEEVEQEEFEKVKSVQVEKMTPSLHSAKVELQGNVRAVDKIEIFSEVQGVLLTDAFKEGYTFKKGQVLAQIDASEFKNSIMAQKSVFASQVAGVMGDIKTDYASEINSWETFLNGIDVNQSLPSLPEVKDVKLKRFLSGKNLLNTYYLILAKEEKLSKYSITAPYDGVVTQSMVNKGTLVRPGQKLGEFINPSNLEYVTEVSVSDLKFLKVGNQVLLYSEDYNEYYKGRVYRINEKLESNSQRVKVFVKLSGKGLKEGMFLSAKLESQGFENSYEINRLQISNSKVYAVSDGLVKVVKVEVLHAGDNMAIVKGLNEGDSLIVGSLKGLYPKLKVTVQK